MQPHIILEPVEESYGTTVSNTTISLPGTIPDSARSIQIQAETQPVRVRWDGTDPTESVGFLLSTGETYRFDGRKYIDDMVLIRGAGSDATINVVYESWN
jgi:hypothetical protein